MENRKTTMKEHIFICMISLALIVALIILTIHFFKNNEFHSAYITGFVICYLWIPSILPAGYYYVRAETNSFYKRQPKFIFHLDNYSSFVILILIAPFLVPNYIWLLYVDIKNYKRNKSWEKQK